MLPLGTIGMDGKLVGAEDLQKQLNSLKDIGTEGVMVDCWWGLVEPEPQKYKWEGYRSLFDLVRSVNLKLQVVMSFHECGGNVGDDVHIPLPRWILEIGRENQDIFFTDKENRRNEECLSWGVDFQPVLDGRTAIKVYEDFMKSFHSEFDDLLQGGDITEIEVGMGPCGELRYPSYPSKHGWTYPGIGEFQCYDKYMLESLKSDAELMGVKDWENPPSNVGSYNSRAEDTGFFCDGGGYDSFHGRFFLKWYSSLLIAHGNDMLETAKEVFTATPIAVKLSGIHWWFKTFSHAAELTAGFYNPSTRDGYSPIASMVKKNKATLNFTCVELRTEDQNREFSFAFPDPEGLVWQVLNVAWDVGIYCLAILGKDTIKFWKLQSRLVIHWEDNYLALPI